MENVNPLANIRVVSRASGATRFDFFDLNGGISVAANGSDCKSETLEVNIVGASPIATTMASC